MVRVKSLSLTYEVFRYSKRKTGKDNYIKFPLELTTGNIIKNLLRFIWKYTILNSGVGRTINHPWNLVHHTFPEIEKWRAESPYKRRYQLPASISVTRGQKLIAYE